MTAVNAPKILNIDSFVEPKRQVVINGKTHDILELNVQQFIDNLAATEALEAKIAAGEPVDLRLSTQMRDSVAAVKQAIPSLSEAEISALTMTKLTTLLTFIRGDVDPRVSEPAPAGEGAPTEEGDPAKKP